MPEPLHATKLALVEGKDEVRFYSAIVERSGFGGIEIRSFEGINNLKGTLEALRGIEGFDRVAALGIVRDAEGDGQAALQSVKGALGATGFAVPAAALQRKEGNPAVVFLINPHGKPAGRFEDVCAESVMDTGAMGCVEAYIHCLKALGAGIPTREWKTRVHAFIAAQEHPEVSLGVAARYGYFPLDHGVFATIRQLFELLDGPQTLY